VVRELSCQWTATAAALARHARVVSCFASRRRLQTDGGRRCDSAIQDGFEAVGSALVRVAGAAQRLIAQSACEQLASPAADTRGVPGAWLAE
jgi:hypothetical protein